MGNLGRWLRNSVLSAGVLTTAALVGSADAGTSDESRQSRIINNYLINRTNEIIRNDPNLIQRLNATGTDVSVSGNADSWDGKVDLQSRISGADAKLSRMFNQGRLDRLSLWVNGSFSRAEETLRDRDHSLVYFGLDYRVSSRLVVGLAGQYDELSEIHAGDISDKSRMGWLAGPYLVRRLHENLSIDTRASFGKSVIALNLIEDEDKLETDRVMLKSQLTGNFKYDGWHVSPALSVVYFEEDSAAYQATNGVLALDDQVTLGRLTFGPRLTRTFDLPNGMEVTPNFRLQGSWDFDQTPIINVSSGQLSTPDPFRAKLESVITAKVSEERKFNLNTYYGGIGVAGYDAFGVKLGMTVALQ